MPARRDPGAKLETRLARARARVGVTQEELARAIGISEPTLRRLERGQSRNPPLRYLINASICLGVELEDLIEDEWREWMTFDQRASVPPRPEEFFRRPYRPLD